MTWPEIRQSYPREWLLVEALEARSQGGKRVLEKLAVVDHFGDGAAAMRGYLQLHRGAPDRELYVLHTDRLETDIEERFWLGLRPADGPRQPRPAPARKAPPLPIMPLRNLTGRPAVASSHRAFDGLGLVQML